MTRETIVKLETSIDHLTAEEIGAALRILNAMPETLDASYFSGIGKKNRPCGKLEVLCRKGNEELVAMAVFRHTHTLGLRLMEIERLVLDRETARTVIGGQKVDAKIYTLEGTRYQRPEAADLARLAEEQGLGMPALRIGKAQPEE